MIARPRSYRGALFRRCNSSIPVSPRAVSLQGELGYQEINTPHPFMAHCRLCECESIYVISDSDVRQRATGAKLKSANRWRLTTFVGVR
jgi:hypothetical protein